MNKRDSVKLGTALTSKKAIEERESVANCMRRHVRYMYFESEEGGMSNWIVDSVDDLKSLYGWMGEGCVKDDRALLNWMRTASIGECFEHRLGVLVRMADSKI